MRRASRVLKMSVVAAVLVIGVAVVLALRSSGRWAPALTASTPLESPLPTVIVVEPYPLDSPVRPPDPTVRPLLSEAEITEVMKTYAAQQFPDKSGTAQVIYVKQLRQHVLRAHGIMANFSGDPLLQVMILKTDSDTANWSFRKPEAPVIQVNYLLLIFEGDHGGLAGVSTYGDDSQLRSILDSATSPAYPLETATPAISDATPVASP
jgi:hypothetical protein